jgi:tetratricopeptide (TPR) repeat protein
MHDNDDIQFRSDNLQEIQSVMREGTRIVCGTSGSASDFPAALARFSEAFLRLAPKMNALAAADDAGSQRAWCFVLFREIWKHVPCPGHDFRPLPLPKQERNGLCPCGSGQKFKQCCAAHEVVIPPGTQGWNLLKYVLEDLPISSYEKLPFAHLSPHELAFVAEQWLEEGRAEATTFLLVPLLAEVKKLDARHEMAFDALGDAYLQLDMPEQRIELIEKMMQASDPTLRSAAMHRRCTIYSDAGDWTAAWKLFAKAERLQPDNPALSHLETIMLASEGRTERAKERARYWLARLAQPGPQSEDDPLLDFLRVMSEDPDAALAMMRDEGEDLADDSDGFLNAEDLFAVLPLFALVQALPAAQCFYTLQPANGDAGPLRAHRELAALERQWRKLFQLDPEDPLAENNPWQNTEWLNWLAANPLAGQSFEILGDLSEFVEETPATGELGEAFYYMGARLMERAKSLLEQVIADNKAQGCRLEWAWEENRPALLLLENYIELLDDAAEETRLLEWLLGTLNPADQQGLRESLARVLLENGRAADALAWCERYPDDDLAAMLYARVLALHQLDRLGEAAAALAVARAKRPLALSALLAADPAEPDLDFDTVTVGGEDEAWYYRMDWRSVWERLEALDWLEQAAQK